MNLCLLFIIFALKLIIYYATGEGGSDIGSFFLIITSLIFSDMFLLISSKLVEVSNLWYLIHGG